MKSLTLTGVLFGALLSLMAQAAEPIPFDQISHIHGIAVNPKNTSQLYLATHHGLYLASQDGTAVAISQTRDDLMGFSLHPNDPDMLYASGHPSGGGNLGLIVSHDAGKTWQQLSPGAHGPVDFHAMTVSKADPQVLYGTHGGLQTSRDGGKTWQIVGPLPGRVIDIAASGTEADTLYAAAQEGLLVSKDGGLNWRPAYLVQRPTSMVETGYNGELYAFMADVGLIKYQNKSWTRLARSLGDRFVLHLAVDSQDVAKLYAVTQKGEILASADGGQTWGPFAP